MPRFKENAHSFNINVVKNQRADGKYQYKATLPKRLVDFAFGTGKQVSGEFFLVQADREEERTSIAFRLKRYRNSSMKTQKEQHQATWTTLKCPYCGLEAEPLIFSKGENPISVINTHSCGAQYYADRSDNRAMSEIEDTMGFKSKDWTLIHNYQIQIGRVASSLPEDFDILENDDRLVHVIFLKPNMSGSKYANPHSIFNKA